MRCRLFLNGLNTCGFSRYVTDSCYANISYLIDNVLPLHREKPIAALSSSLLAQLDAAASELLKPTENEVHTLYHTAQSCNLYQIAK